MSLTPLVDVIFLLLLFFMLTSTFSKFGEIELSHATAGAAKTVEPAERSFLQLGPDRLVLNGTSVSLDDLGSSIGTGQVLVSLDAQTTSQRLVDLLVRLRGIDELSVTVLE